MLALGIGMILLGAGYIFKQRICRTHLNIVGAAIFIFDWTKKISQSNNKGTFTLNVPISFNQQMVTCMQCGAQINALMEFCLKCGFKNITVEKSKPNACFYKSCGEKIRSDEKFCHSCKNVFT